MRMTNQVCRVCGRGQSGVLRLPTVEQAVRRLIEVTRKDFIQGQGQSKEQAHHNQQEQEQNMNNQTNTQAQPQPKAKTQHIYRVHIADYDLDRESIAGMAAAGLLPCVEVLADDGDEAMRVAVGMCPGAVHSVERVDA